MFHVFLIQGLDVENCSMAQLELIEQILDTVQKKVRDSKHLIMKRLLDSKKFAIWQRFTNKKIKKIKKTLKLKKMSKYYNHRSFVYFKMIWYKCYELFIHFFLDFDDAFRPILANCAQCTRIADCACLMCNLCSECCALSHLTECNFALHCAQNSVLFVSNASRCLSIFLQTQSNRWFGFELSFRQVRVLDGFRCDCRRKRA